MSSLFSDPTYSGCSAFSESKCKSKDDVIKEKIEGVKTTETCQYYCNTIYKETCKYFMFDNKMQTCTILNTSDIDSCVKTAGGILSNVTFCDPIFDDGVYAHSCLVR